MNNKTKCTDISWNEIDKKKMMGFGTLFLFGTRTLVYPATVIKTRVQCSPTESNATLMFKHIISTQGPKGLYKGFFVMAGSLIPTQALYYTSYEWIKEQVSNACIKFEERETQISKAIFGMKKKFKVASALELGDKEAAILINDGAIVVGESESVSLYRNVVSNLIAGSTSSLISQIIVVPVDVVQQRVILDNQNMKTGRGVLKTAVGIIQREGFKGIYKGSSISATTYATASGIWWLVYSIVKQRIDNIPGIAEENQIVAIQALSGSAASLTAVACTHPLDVIKTKIQSTITPDGKRARIRTACKTIIQEEGYSALFRKGLTARLMNSVPISVMMILSYEAAKRWSVKQ